MRNYALETIAAVDLNQAAEMNEGEERPFMAALPTAEDVGFSPAVLIVSNQAKQPPVTQCL